MPVFTNKLRLPKVLFDAIVNDPYDPGSSDITVTSLIKPPLIHQLEKRHDVELEVDVADRIYAVMGSIGHNIIERAGSEGNIVEKRFYIERKGWKIGGQADLVIEGSEADLWDWKFTSRWVAMDGEKPEWAQQINMLAYMCRKNGISIKSGQVGAVYRDWSKGAARRDKQYPPQQVEIFPIRLWSDVEVEAFIDMRLDAHQRAARLADDQIPLCTMNERWQDPDKWAVMKKGGKRAVKLHTSEAEASQHAASLPGGYVEYRKSEPKRCIDYCAARQFCRFWKDECKEWHGR